MGSKVNEKQHEMQDSKHQNVNRSNTDTTIGGKEFNSSLTQKPTNKKSFIKRKDGSVVILDEPIMTLTKDIFDDGKVKVTAQKRDLSIVYYPLDELKLFLNSSFGSIKVGKIKLKNGGKIQPVDDIHVSEYHPGEEKGNCYIDSHMIHDESINEVLNRIKSAIIILEEHFPEIHTI
jgi:hypothetical protein